MFANVASLRLTADFAGPNELVLVIRAECQPDVEEDVPASLQFLFDISLHQVQEDIRDMGAALTGATRVEGRTIIGEYVLSGLDKLVAAEGDIGTN